MAGRFRLGPRRPAGKRAGILPDSGTAPRGRPCGTAPMMRQSALSAGSPANRSLHASPSRIARPCPAHARPVVVGAGPGTGRRGPAARAKSGPEAIAPADIPLRADLDERFSQEVVQRTRGQDPIANLQRRLEAWASPSATRASISSGRAAGCCRSRASRASSDTGISTRSSSANCAGTSRRSPARTPRMRPSCPAGGPTGKPRK